MTRIIRASAALGLVLALVASSAPGLGCTRDVAKDPARSPDDPAPTAAAAAKEKRVHDVASAKDLLDVQTAYLQQIAAGFDGRFEVRFTAAIPQTGWSLAPEPGKPVPPIDLVITGQ